jgi:hypothetical protein
VIQYYNINFQWDGPTHILASSWLPVDIPHADRFLASPLIRV